MFCEVGGHGRCEVAGQWTHFEVDSLGDAILEELIVVDNLVSVTDALYMELLDRL